MTKYISLKKTQEKKTEPTIFTKFLDKDLGWKKSRFQPTFFKKVIYLGNCSLQGDMFACYTEGGMIAIFKGTKGNEFKKQNKK